MRPIKLNEKMKDYIYTFLALIAILTFYFYNNPLTDFKSDKTDAIQFHRTDWKETLQLAKREKKLIFLDIYATWCGPCKKLKSGTFSNNEVGKYYNTHFINVSLDGEKGEGATLANQYNINSYPTLFFIDSDGKIVFRSGGYLNPSEFLDLGKSVSNK